MNGLDPQGSEGPYFNAPQQQPPTQPNKRKGDEESPAGGGQRVSNSPTITSLLDTGKPSLIRMRVPFLDQAQSIHFHRMQRVQASQNQMQWRNSMPQMRKPIA